MQHVHAIFLTGASILIYEVVHLNHNARSYVVRFDMLYGQDVRFKVWPL